MHSTIIMLYAGVDLKLPFYRADTVFMALSLFGHAVLKKVCIFCRLIATVYKYYLW